MNLSLISYFLEDEVLCVHELCFQKNVPYCEMHAVLVILCLISGRMHIDPRFWFFAQDNGIIDENSTIEEVFRLQNAAHASRPRQVLHGNPRRQQHEYMLR